MQIVYHPDPILRQRAAPLAGVDATVRGRAAEMVELMLGARGIGLAAPQVGWRARLCIVCPTGERGDEIVLVNPEILAAEGEEVAEEGCLSFPQVYGKVPRAARIRYRLTDLEGEEVVREAEGVEARAVQHEIDHLDGIVFLMRMTPADRFAARRTLKELERRYQEQKTRV